MWERTVEKDKKPTVYHADASPEIRRTLCGEVEYTFRIYKEYKAGVDRVVARQLQTDAGTVILKSVSRLPTRIKNPTFKNILDQIDKEKVNAVKLEI